MNPPQLVIMSAIDGKVEELSASLQQLKEQVNIGSIDAEINSLSNLLQESGLSSLVALYL